MSGFDIAPTRTEERNQIETPILYLFKTSLRTPRISENSEPQIKLFDLIK